MTLRGDGMEKEKLERINFLARRAKTEKLTREELDEQAALRAEYIAEIRASFGAQLDNTVIVRPDGTREHRKRIPKSNKRIVNLY